MKIMNGQAFKIMKFFPLLAFLIMMEPIENEWITVTYKTGESGDIYINECEKTEQPRVICCYKGNSDGETPMGCYNLEEIKSFTDQHGHRVKLPMQ